MKKKGVKIPKMKRGGGGTVEESSKGRVGGSEEQSLLRRSLRQIIGKTEKKKFSAETGRGRGNSYKKVDSGDYKDSTQRVGIGTQTPNQQLTMGISKSESANKKSLPVN